MPPKPGTPVPATPTAHTKKPVEIFRTGTYDGETYGLPFLKKVVENWKKYQQKQNDSFPTPVAYWISPDFAKEIANKATVGIGHEDDQAFLKMLLKRTDLPAAGLPTNVHLDGESLMADLDDMPEAVAALVNGKQLITCSAEFYPDCIDGVTGESVGPMLRRVSLLGGEIPKVKGMPLSTMVFSERQKLSAHSHRDVKSIVYFSEIRAIAKDASGHEHADDGKFAATGEAAKGTAATHKKLVASRPSGMKHLGYDESVAAQEASKKAEKSGSKEDHAAAQQGHQKAQAEHVAAAKRFESNAPDAAKLHEAAAKAHGNAAGQHGVAAGTIQPSQFAEFAELRPIGDLTMDRQALIAALQKMGVDTGSIDDSCSMQALGAWLRSLQAAKGAISTSAEPKPVPGMATAPAPMLTAAEDDLIKNGGSDGLRGKNQAAQLRAMNSPGTTTSEWGRRGR